MDIVSPKVIRERELEKQRIVSEDQNLLVLLFFAHDFDKSSDWIARALRAPVVTVEETASVLQGYGYLIIKEKSGEKHLHLTSTGKRLVAKIRSNLKAP